MMMIDPRWTQGERPRIILAAPNVSRRMGGEAIKALSIFEGYKALGFDVTQITHARVRDELSAIHRDDVVYIEDGPVQIGLYRLKLDWLLGVVSSWLLGRAVQREVRLKKPWIVHFTSPISPSGINFPIRGAPVVIGPLNGNLLHPPALLFRESRSKRIGATLTRPLQMVSRIFFRGKLDARLFVSGGERTVRVLEMGGCKRSRIAMTLDSGVDRHLRDQPRIDHCGDNWNFVFLGRLVRYKGCDLVIRAMKHVPQATLDIIGDGEEGDALRTLAEVEGVGSRVRFHGYVTDRDVLFERLKACRGFLFPTLAEANGIAIQEAMMVGLPIVCVNWGGPQQLLDSDIAILIEPESEETIVTALASAMSRLATDPALAESLSLGARAVAERRGFDWPNVLQAWIALYDEWLEECGSPHRFVNANQEATEDILPMAAQTG